MYVYSMFECMRVLGGALTARNELENQDTNCEQFGAAAATSAELQRPRLTLYTGLHMYANVHIHAYI